MAEEAEKLGAERRAKEEERLKSLMSKPPGSKGAEGAYGGKNRKGKDAKGVPKGGPGEGGKGKGGQGGREDNRGSWPKKNEK